MKKCSKNAWRMPKEKNDNDNILWDDMSTKDKLNLLFQTLVVPILIVLLLNCIIGLAHTVGSSMESTLHNGQWFIIQRIGNYKQEDIITFKCNNRSLVKRIIGVEGDVLQFSEDGSTVYRNGEPLEELYLDEGTLTFPGDCGTTPFVVPENCVFVLGDNREHSTDSRYSSVGFVSLNDIYGKMIFAF